MTLDFGRIDLSELSARSSGQTSHPADHFVEVYDHDRSLIESLRTYVSVGIAEGDAVVVVAEPSHTEALEAELSRAIDLQRARRRGVYVSLDAAETLAAFMRDGLPDRARFQEVIGGIITAAAARGNNVRVFGEMVAILWAEGNVRAALALEDLWNELRERYPFRLFCGYPTSGFNEDDLELVGSVCDRHSHIVLSQAEAL